MEIFEYVVDSETEGMRIDRYLKKTFKHEPLSKIFQALRKGDVKVGGKKVKENYRLSLNERISVKYLKAETVSNENKNFKKNKIEKKVLDKYKKCVIFENRLDYETSGLVIGCKTLKFLRYISEKIRNNEVRKKYIAIVHGIIEEEEFTIENYLLVEENGVSVTENETEGKKSITEFRCIGRKKSRETNVKNPENIGKTALDINLVTGRKHQIRAQISDYGYPIVGDRKYGKNDKSDVLYLCCYYVAFDEYEYEIEKKFLNNQIMW